MKRRIFKILCLVLCGITLISSTPVYANTKDTYKTNNRVIKSRIKDSKGNIIVEYYDFEYLPESSGSFNNCKPTLDLSTVGLNATNMTMAINTAPTYTSSLSGAYDDYTQALGISESTQFIDNIYVYMDTWYAQGTYFGNDWHTNPSGTTTDNQTAFLEIPDNPFNFMFGSAFSQHTYTCTGYEYVSRTLTWDK